MQESRRVYGTPDKELIITQAQENFGGDVFSYLSGRIGGVRVLRAQNPCSLCYPEDAVVIIRGQKNEVMVDCGGPPIKVPIGALILLDGFEINPENLSMVLTLPMNIVDRIDVLMASPLYGSHGANGVINIITRVGIRRDPFVLGPNAASVIINGYDAPRIFYSPKHDADNKSAYLPDNRSTFFWEPNIKVGNNKPVKLEYFNADDKSDISIIVEGITEEGIPLTGRNKYEVK